MDSEITAEGGHCVNVYTRDSLKPIRNRRKGIVVGLLVGLLFIALILLSYTTMKLMKLSNTTLPEFSNFSFF